MTSKRFKKKIFRLIFPNEFDDRRTKDLRICTLIGKVFQNKIIILISKNMFNSNDYLFEFDLFVDNKNYLHLVSKKKTNFGEVFHS